MDRLFLPPADRLSQEEAMRLVRPFRERLVSAVQDGLALYGKVDPQVRSDIFDFAEGGVIYSLVAKSLERTLRETAGIRYELHENSVRIFVGDSEQVVMRIAKTGWERVVGRVSDNSDKLRDAYYFMEPVKGILSNAFRLTLGYIPDTVTWAPSSVFVSRQIGRDVDWFEELMPGVADGGSNTSDKPKAVPIEKPHLQPKSDATVQVEEALQDQESQRSDEN